MVFIFAWDVKGPELKSSIGKRLVEYKGDIFHFSLGALLSLYSLLFFQSASLSKSFVVILFFMGLMVLNEGQKFQRGSFFIKNLCFSICLFCFIQISTTILIGRISYWVFALSSLIYLGLEFVFLKYIYKKSTFFRDSLITSILCAVIFNGLYLTNLIPPLPLNLKFSGIFRKLERVQNEYHLYHRDCFLCDDDSEFFYKEGDRVYIFASVFSPGGFKDKAIFQWEKFDSGKFLVSDKIPVSVRGGRVEGYRGFTYKDRITPGQWRVRFLTDEGLEFGIKYFEVIESNEEDMSLSKIVK